MKSEVISTIEMSRAQDNRAMRTGLSHLEVRYISEARQTEAWRKEKRCDIREILIVALHAKQPLN